MNRTGKSALVFALTASLVLSSAGTADAKAKKPKLSKSKVTITVGKTKKITVKKAKPKKTKWTVNKKGKKIVKLSKKKKKSVVIKGKKTGKATVTAKITVGKKTYKKKVKVTVKKKASGGGGTTPTQNPGTGTPTPKPGTPTQNPGTPTKDPGTATDAPTNAPTDAPTNAPTDVATDAPTDAPTNAPTNAPSDDPSYDPTIPHDIDLANDVVSSDVTKNADGSITVEGTNPVIKLPTTFAEGTKVKIRIEGEKGADAFRYYLLQGEADGSRSSAVASSSADGVPQGKFYWTKTLTVEEGDAGCTTASYIIFKGATYADPMPKLTITKITILAQDSTEADGAGSLGGSEDETPTPSPSAGTETPDPSTGPAVTPETEEVPYEDTKKDDQDVREYKELDASADYVVKANGSEVEITADVLAKVFDTDKIAELWAKDDEIEYEDPIYGKKVVVSKPDTLGQRTVTVIGKNKTEVYTAVKVNEGTPEGTLKFQLTDENKVVEVITITDGKYEVTRDDVTIVSIEKDASGTYTMDLDKAWVDDVGFVLSKVKKGGSTPPTASGPAVSGPGVNPPASGPAVSGPGAGTATPTVAPTNTAEPTAAAPTDTPAPTAVTVDLKTAVKPTAGVTVNEDGSVEFTDKDLVVNLPEKYTEGTEMKVEMEVENNATDGKFRFYLTDDGATARSNVFNPTGASLTEGAYTAEADLTVNENAKVNQLLFKGAQYQSFKGTLKIKSLKITVTKTGPFDHVMLKGAGQYTELGRVTYTVGDNVPTGFDIKFTATNGAGVNLTISANGNESNYGVGGAREKSCDLTFTQWGEKPAVGTLKTGDSVTIVAVASGANEVAEFQFTSITPTGSGSFENVDISKVEPYEYKGTAGGFTPVLTTTAIAPDLDDSKTLADYSKVVIEAEATGLDLSSLNYSIVAAGNETDAFVVYGKNGKFEILLSAENFNSPNDWQKIYNTLDDALALKANTVRLKVTAATKGYKGKITIKSVTLVEK